MFAISYMYERVLEGKKYGMKTLSTLLALLGALHRSPEDSLHNGPEVWCIGVFTLAKTTCWTNSRVVGGLRRCDTHVTSL